MSRQLFKDNFYHICNKSIANFGIFKDSLNITRFIKSMSFYNSSEKTKSLSEYLKTQSVDSISNPIYQINGLIKIISYCIMFDHYHLLIKVNQNNSVAHYINNIENSFTRFFNIKFKRKGPLWQSAFKFIEIKSNEQLMHISRYIHLNPTTAGLVEKPEDWRFSSYKYFIGDTQILKKFVKEISIRTPKGYRTFVENQIDYQRKLKIIKKVLLE